MSTKRRWWWRAKLGFGESQVKRTVADAEDAEGKSAEKEGAVEYLLEPSDDPLLILKEDICKRIANGINCAFTLHLLSEVSCRIAPSMKDVPAVLDYKPGRYRIWSSKGAQWIRLKVNEIEVEDAQ